MNIWDTIPATLEEAFDRLGHLKDVDKWTAMDEDEAIALAHHSIGRSMRNCWGLWSKTGQLYKFLADKGLSHADDMSGVVTRSFHRKISGKPLRIDAQVKKYLNYWKDMRVNEIKDLVKEYGLKDNTGWLGSDPSKAFLLCVGSGPWNAKRREKVQSNVLAWYKGTRRQDIKTLDLHPDKVTVFPLAWQNNVLYTLHSECSDNKEAFAKACLRWTRELEDPMNATQGSVEEFFRMCGYNKKGIKTLWLFVRDFLELPAFPIDRHVERVLKAKGLPCNPWEMIDRCIEANVDPNKLSRALFYAKSTNPEHGE